MLIIIIIGIWIGLCVGVGYLANSIGRDFANYMILSIFLTPIVGVIVLAVQGRPTDGELASTQPQPPHIYYCTKCETVYSSVGRYKELCQKCKILLFETEILTDNWNTLPNETRAQLKEAFKRGEHAKGKGYKKIEPKHEDATDLIQKYKGLLDSGAITQEEYDAKKKQLLGI